MRGKSKYLLRRLVADSIDGPCLFVACDPPRMGTDPTEDWIRIRVISVDGVGGVKVYLPF